MGAREGALSRTPPIAVRRTLRGEVGFGCPVRQAGNLCGNPYLRWHHFDPAWSDEHHHRPEGMIASCAQHHDEADAGAFTRDPDGYALVNLGMLSTSPAPRAHMEENFWTVIGDPADVDCPPSGRILDVRYPNEDRLRIEFRELPNVEAAHSRYSDGHVGDWGVDFPLTAVEIQMNVGGTDVRFGPRHTSLPGGDVMQNCFMRGGAVGLHFAG